MAKKLYWLKLKKDFFNDKEVKKLRRIAGGDLYIIIYLKLLLLSLENEGIIYFDGVEDNFEDEMSLVIDEAYENIKFTVTYLIKRGLMIQLSNDQYEMTEARSMTLSESESAERVRRHRQRLSTNTLQCNDKALQLGYIVQNCNTEIEIDIEKDKESISNDIPKKVCDIDFNSFLVFWNHYADEYQLSKINSLTDSRKRKIRTRMLNDKDFVNNLGKAINAISESKFLLGKNGSRGWKVNFDWLIENDTNYLKVLEGSYSDGKAKESELWDAISEHETKQRAADEYIRKTAAR